MPGVEKPIGKDRNRYLDIEEIHGYVYRKFYINRIIMVYFAL